MISSSVPGLVPLPFAANGSKHAIPTNSQIGITAGAASLNDGFPPLTFTPIASGGVPPDGNDMNGILNLISANTNWANAGGTYPYNSAFSTYIGGYPKGAVLGMAAGTGFWLSTIDNNTTNPESGPSANWIAFGPYQTQGGANNYSADTGTANTYVVTLSPTPAALIPGLVARFVAAHTNTGASTLNVNGTGALTISPNGTSAMLPGQIFAGALVTVVFDGTRWQVINPYAIAASTALAGTSRFGTNAEQLAGLLTNVGCTPAGLASGQSLLTNGYKPLPGGFIFQWCTGSNQSTRGNQVVTLPQAFPTSCLQVGVSSNALSGAEANKMWQLISFTTTNVTLFLNDFGTSSALGLTPNIYAIGK
jgi:hypothetical protein